MILILCVPTRHRTRNLGIVPVETSGTEEEGNAVGLLAEVAE